MVNREEESFAVDEAKDLADIVFLLEIGATDWMPSFVDVDGEEVMFNPRRLVWLEACARYVQEGFKELEDENGIES